MQRLVSAFSTFLAVLFAQIFALAAAEGFGGMHIDPFHSRTALFYVSLGLSVAAAVTRFILAGKSAPSAESARRMSPASSAGPAPVSAGAGQRSAPASAFGAAG